METNTPRTLLKPFGLYIMGGDIAEHFTLSLINKNTQNFNKVI